MQERGRGEGGASNEIRTVMEEIEVGRENMDEEEEAEVEQDNAEAE